MNTSDTTPTVEDVAAALDDLARPSVVHGKWILAQLARELRAAPAAPETSPAELAELPVTGVDSSARDRAIEAVRGVIDRECDCENVAVVAAVDALLAHPEVLRALAGVATPDAAEPAGEVREEWAVWEDTHTDDPNDEAARVRRVNDRADAEDYVIMPKARRRSIARRTVTRSRWVAVDTHHEEAAPMADRETTATPAEVCSCPWPHDELARREWPHVPLSLARAYADEYVQTGRRP